MHAYLIIAHDQFDLLESLLKCIDDERNDIYIHIDSHSKLDIAGIQNILQNSRITHRGAGIRRAVVDQDKLYIPVCLRKYTFDTSVKMLFRLVDGNNDAQKFIHRIHLLTPLSLSRSFEKRLNGYAAKNRRTADLPISPGQRRHIDL